MGEEPFLESPFDLLCEYTADPLGMDVLKPRFSWKLRHYERGRTQLAYQILVASSMENILKDIGDMWDTGKVTSSQSINVEYAGKPFKSGKTYYWKVRWWDDKERVSSWSRIAKFEMGLLRQEDWKAKWIGGGKLLRKSFMVKGKVKQARAYVSGLGYYELRINGRKVGDRVLDPGWTDYEKIVLYTTYDVTDYLKEGENIVGIMLGNGRYNVKPYRRNLHKHYGEPRAILQIGVDYVDGDQDLIISDESPKSNVYVVDFGQNFTGWVRLTVSGPRGIEVKLRYAELLNPDGTVFRIGKELIMGL